jgi:hypothetical protein
MIYNIIYKDNNEDPKSSDLNAFNHFINNSSFEFHANGNSGITIIATLNNNILSKYKYINSYNEIKNDGGENHQIELTNSAEDVKKLLLKLVLIKNIAEEEACEPETSTEKSQYTDFDFTYSSDSYDSDDDSNFYYLEKNKLLDYTKKEDFIKEVNTQINIYKKTMQYFQPICPCICYANIYDYNYDNKLFLNKILQNNTDLINILNNYGVKFDSIGLIAMEFIQDSKKLFSLMYNQQYPLYKNMSRYLLLQLAIETEYNHLDFHKYNIFINLNSNNYFKDLYGYPLLIDFGWTEKISANNLELIKNYYNEKKYVEALNILYKTTRRDNVNLENFEAFDWLSKNVICNNIIDITNKEIDNLVNLRNITIGRFSKSFDFWQNTPEIGSSHIICGIACTQQKTLNKNKLLNIKLLNDKLLNNLFSGILLD